MNGLRLNETNRDTHKLRDDSNPDCFQRIDSQKKGL